MPDQLRDLADQRDRANASRSRLEPDRLILPPRNQTTRRVCVNCHQPVDDLKSRAEWWRSAAQRAKYTPPTECPLCGDKLVEVTS